MMQLFKVVNKYKMDDLMEELSTLEQCTDTRQLQQWASRAQAQIDRLPSKEGNVYYLVLSEFYAVKLRDIETGYELLKRVNHRLPVILEQIKVRRCFYRYLEGAYEFALEDLEGIAKASSFSSRKIATAFFKRIFGKGKQSKGRKRSRKPTKQHYEEDLITALNYERNKEPRLARQLHVQILQKYGDMNPTIRYQSVKNVVRLLEFERSKLARDQIGDFQQIIRDYEAQVENKNYYQEKLQFILRVLDLIDPDTQEQDILVDYQLAKKFIIQNLEKAISKTTDSHLKTTLKQTVRSLKTDKFQGDEICFKFLGDQKFHKLYNMNQMSEKSKLKQSKIGNQGEEYIDKSIDPQFQGSIMTKINFNSSGFEDRYFYFKEDFKTTWKLFYCPKKGKQSKEDDYYRLKGLKKMTSGKKSDALKRNECQDFEENLCFTLYINSDEQYERNFYVKEEQDCHQWVMLFNSLLTAKSSQQSRLKMTKRVNI